MEDLTNILSSEDEFTEDLLLEYLMGNTSGEDAHKVEKQMADSDFVNDAVEGLQAIKSPRKLSDYVTQLNNKLQQQLELKKQKKEKREIKHLGWIILAVILILALCILGYVIIHMAREHELHRHLDSVFLVVGGNNRC
ncbi:MAG TPA: hypothetical protein VHB48_08775 [Chitinophagaceae bacterium]|nr:hypothetical protein [Chitinophagaceae bacterium]